jgi:hypothetical protein
VTGIRPGFPPPLVSFRRARENFAGQDFAATIDVDGGYQAKSG